MLLAKFNFSINLLVKKFKACLGQEPEPGHSVYLFFEEQDVPELKVALTHSSQGATLKLRLHLVNQPDIHLETKCEPYRETSGYISGVSLTLERFAEEEPAFTSAPARSLADLPSGEAALPEVPLTKDKETPKTEKYLQTILNDLPLALLVVNREGTCTLARGNDRVKNRYKLGQITGQAIWDLKANRPDLLENWRRALAGETFNQITITSQEEIFHDFYNPLFSPEGELEEVLAVSINVTEQSQIQNRLQIQNKYLEALTQVNLQIINQLDPTEVLQTITTAAAEIVNADRCAIFLLNETGTALVERAGYGTNQANLGMEFSRGEGMAGRVWETGQIINLAEYYNLKKIPDRLNPNNHPARAAIGLPLKRQEEFVGALALSYADASRRFGPAETELLERLAMVAVLTLENARLYTTAQSELAQRKATELALRQSESKLRASINSMPQSFYLLDQNCRVQLFNQRAYQTIQNVRKITLTEGFFFLDLLDPEIHEEFYAAFKQALTGQYLVVEKREYASNGVEFWIEIRYNPVIEADGTTSGVCVTILNISERKRTEQALQTTEARLRMILDNIQQRFYLIDREYRLQLFNRLAAEHYRSDRDQDLIAGHPFDEFIQPDNREKFATYFRRALSGENFTVEISRAFKNGSNMWWEGWFSPALEKDGTISGVCYAAIDITERRLAEMRVKASLTEKEILLKEIHHRVKNNLQIISSLFNLQTSLVQEPATLAALRDSQHRIRSMALIHEKLYQSDQLSQINLRDYLRSLVAQLFRSYQNGSRIEFELHVEDNYWLKLDQAIPCGLIINELITNSLKYAFPQTFQEQAKISISLESSAENQELSLRVRDNGIGLPQGFSLAKLESLGLQLVEMLSQQLNGHFELATGPQGGTSFSLNFTI